MNGCYLFARNVQPGGGVVGIRESFGAFVGGVGEGVG